MSEPMLASTQNLRVEPSAENTWHVGVLFKESFGVHKVITTIYTVSLENLSEPYSYTFEVNFTKPLQRTMWRGVRKHAVRKVKSSGNFEYLIESEKLIPVPSNRQNFFYSHQDLLQTLQPWLPAIPHLTLFLALSDLIESIDAELLSETFEDRLDIEKLSFNSLFKPVSARELLQLQIARVENFKAKCENE